MNEKRPNVFPVKNIPEITPDDVSLPKVSVDSHYEQERLVEADKIYEVSKEVEEIGSGGLEAIDAMRQRTLEQIKLRDAQLQKNMAQTDTYQKQMAEANNRPINKGIVEEPKKIELKPIENKQIVTKSNMNTQTNYIEQLSQPNFNMAYDVLPLPSEGKLYKHKRSSVKVAYMTTADENILTSPNLLQSGEFLEILINRKLLETDMRYKDLHVGDRNAIMLWLRATSYGEMYPVTILDEDDVPFETEINLSELKVKKLGDEPDAEGYFNFFLPVARIGIKFKLLTVGDIEEIERLNKIDRDNEIPINNSSTYTLEKQIIEISGNRERAYIKEYIQGLRILDGQKLKAHINNIESGVELDIEVRTPRGGSIKTFLPLNTSFFWPNLSV